MPTIRRLAPGDEAILELLAAEEADFDLEGRGEALQPLETAVATRFLQNPAVLFWVAFEEKNPVGLLYCVHLPLRAGDGSELLLYEIGVRQSHRRQGIGRALIGEMEQWMLENGVPCVWLGADNPGAESFYRACGFVTEGSGSVFLERRLKRSAD